VSWKVWYCGVYISRSWQCSRGQEPDPSQTSDLPRTPVQWWTGIAGTSTVAGDNLFKAIHVCGKLSLCKLEHSSTIELMKASPARISCLCFRVWRDHRFGCSAGKQIQAQTLDDSQAVNLSEHYSITQQVLRESRETPKRDLRSSSIITHSAR
jgi:hypothetical protein